MMSSLLSASPPEPDPPAVSGGFVVAYTAAQIGAFIGFIPLLTLLLPLKAAAIAPAGKAELLALVALWVPLQPVWPMFSPACFPTGRVEVPADAGDGWRPGWSPPWQATA